MQESPIRPVKMQLSPTSDTKKTENFEKIRSYDRESLKKAFHDVVFDKDMIGLSVCFDDSLDKLIRAYEAIKIIADLELQMKAVIGKYIDTVGFENFAGILKNNFSENLCSA